jgi:hypothetical protein
MDSITLGAGIMTLFGLVIAIAIHFITKKEYQLKVD